MRVALGQINSVLGDFSGNRQKILGLCQQAVDHHVDLIVFPEFSLFGYHPADLLERKSVVAKQLKEFSRLTKQIPRGLGVLVGMVRLNKEGRGKPYYNSAAFLLRGQSPRFFDKELLPNYDVFDEARFLERGSVKNNVLKFKGKNILVTICEDIWAWEAPFNPAIYRDNPIKKLKPGVFDFVVNLSASPFTDSKLRIRRFLVTKTAKYLKAPMVYVNLVGGQDELTFDGGSFAVDKTGKLFAQSLFFEEDFNIVDLKKMEGGNRPFTDSREERMRQALVLGIRDFVHKIGFKKVHLGLSGGIDSALVAALAADAVGPSNVLCVGLPGPFSAPESLAWAKQLAASIGCEWREAPIVPAYDTVVQSLEAIWPNLPFSFVHENLQARLRGLILMAISNKESSLLLTTGNKSEYAAGYTTLYGDMCGGLAPIADLLKSQVTAIAELYNREVEVIPRKIISREPTAELRPGQKDSDTLPAYGVLDKAVKKLVTEAKAPTGKTEQWLLRALMSSEFKRWQAPPILKVSQHAFGRGRRLPIAHKGVY